MESTDGIAKLNDRLRKSMSLGQLNIELSTLVQASSERAKILQAIREFQCFDPELDVNADHSVGVVIISGEAYVFRITYGDERYDYVHEIGQRTLSIFHLSEFRSLKIGGKVTAIAKRMLEQGIG